MKKILNELRCKLFGHNLVLLAICPAGISIRRKDTCTICNFLHYCDRCSYNEADVFEGEEITFFGDVQWFD